MSMDPQPRWEELNRDIRRLESEIENRLVAYSKLGATYQSNWLRDDTAINSSVSDGLQSLLNNNEHLATSTAAEIERLLLKLSEYNEQLSRCLASIEQTVGTSSHHHLLQHHRGKYSDYSKDFAKIKENIRLMEVVSNARKDISSQAKNPAQPSSRTDTLLRERASLHNSERITDDLITQALETREALAAQKNFLRGTLSNITTMTGSFAGINTIINSIRRKKSRDCIVLSLLIIFLLCFLIWYRFGGG